MNTFQQQLWDDLMALVAESEAFYFADQEKGGEYYRIFNYRLASYTEFLKPNALECRGTTFQIHGVDEFSAYEEMPVRLAVLPMEKFFNLYENPMTMDLDLSVVDGIWDKLDGSLISSYMSNEGELWLKSKGSLASDQAKAAYLWLLQHPAYMDKVYYCTSNNYTVNFEWMAPQHRIVIGYEEPILRVLNVRNMFNGTYLSHSYVKDLFGDRAVDEVEIDVSPEEFIQAIPDMQGIEGYVLQLPQQRVKIKTLWYLALHHTKDNINSPRRLFEAVLEEATDDMRTLFHDDPLALKTIQEMEEFVGEKYNHMVDSVERFYERNKHLSRKEYAILGQQEFAGTFYFGLAMNKYTGREFSYKEFLKSKWKQLGLKDLEKDDE